VAGDRGPLKGLRAGVLTCSSSRSPADDGSGDALVAAVEAAGGAVVERALLPDDRAAIAGLLRRWCDAGEVELILTTGGTGLGPHDVTPEATLDVAERLVPGLAECLRAEGARHTPFAWLSRGVAALRGRTLIVNLAGSPSAVRQGLDILLPLLPHARAIIQGAHHPS
jgi:molybdenum cofactor synthesis domain-containing protein